MDDASALWDVRLRQLVAYRQENGNCAVPKADGHLGSWVGRQRELAKKGKLSAERATHLREVGFVWDANDAAWEAQYSMLVSYYRENGHSCVPSAYPSLGIWVAKQRGKARCHKISAERIARLNSLAFVWSPSDAKWMEKYAHLRDYFMATGHSSIPFQGECELERLGWWANTQRQAYRKGRLSNDRVSMLEKLHFVWRPSRFGKRGMVREELPTWEKRARGEDNSSSSSFYDESMQNEQDNSAMSSASTRVYTYRVKDSIRKEAPVPQSALATPLSSPHSRVFPVQKQSAAVIAPERSSKDQMPRSPATWHTSSESSVHRFKTQGGLSQHDEERRVYGFPRIPPIATLFATAEARFVSHNRPWE